MPEFPKSRFICAEPGCLWVPKYMDTETGQLWCGVHARTRRLPPDTPLRKAVGAVQATGTAVDITEDPAVARINAKLAEHEETCAPCRGARTWTVTEAAEGRVTTRADVQRVGEYCSTHCCSYGLRLRHALGLVMMGMPAILPVPDS
jgi:hypothetical protein